MSERLEKLRKTLASRKGQPGYEKNVETIETEIKRLESGTGPPG